MRHWKAVLGLVTLVAGTANAGVLGPTKPSQLVNVFASVNSSGQVCGFPAFDHQISADGTFDPFDIPAGQVLVVTGLEWSSYAGTASQLAKASVVMRPGQMNCLGGFSESAAITDASGRASGSVTFSAGIAVKSGVHLGVFISNGTLDVATLYGYLTKDR